jgi:hypothetical protein
VSEPSLTTPVVNDAVGDPLLAVPTATHVCPVAPFPPHPEVYGAPRDVHARAGGAAATNRRPIVAADKIAK